MASVYRKTDKGIAEIETRAHRLTPRLRTALIMVDGRRSEHDLRTLIAAEPDEVLNTLLTQGFIEVSGTAAPPRGAVAAAPSSSASVAGEAAAEARPANGRSINWEERRRHAVRFLNDNLGPSAESLVLKIEKAKSWDELKPHLEMGEHFLRSARGSGTAREFATKFLEPPAH